MERRETGPLRAPRGNRVAHLVAAGVMSAASIKAVSAAPADDWRGIADACMTFMTEGKYAAPEGLTLSEIDTVIDKDLLCMEGKFSLDAEVPECAIHTARFKGNGGARVELKWRGQAEDPYTFDEALCSPDPSGMQSFDGVSEAVDPWLAAMEGSGRMERVKDDLWHGCSQQGRAWRMSYARKFGPIILFTSGATSCQP